MDFFILWEAGGVSFTGWKHIVHLLLEDLSRDILHNIGSILIQSKKDKKWLSQLADAL